MVSLKGKGLTNSENKLEPLISVCVYVYYVYDVKTRCRHKPGKELDRRQWGVGWVIGEEVAVAVLERREKTVNYGRGG